MGPCLLLANLGRLNFPEMLNSLSRVQQMQIHLRAEGWHTFIFHFRVLRNLLRMHNHGVLLLLDLGSRYYEVHHTAVTVHPLVVEQLLLEEHGLRGLITKVIYKSGRLHISRLWLALDQHAGRALLFDLVVRCSD